MRGRKVPRRKIRATSLARIEFIHGRLAQLQLTMPTTVLKKLLAVKEIPKYDTIPQYMYTEKDALNRITVLKETSKETYLIAGRYASSAGDGRYYNPLTDPEKEEIERMLRASHRDAVISFL